MKQFERLFEPRAIAVVGASEDALRPGSQTVHTLLRYGYAGKIYPVNPKYPQFEGLECYPSIAAIDGDIDVAVIGVPARGVLPIIEQCAQKKVGFVVVLSGGFRESGPEGVTRQNEMLAIARRAGMRIVGPNCLGIANIHNDVYAAFGSITRPPKLKPGAVSLVTQSGGFGYSIALACAREGIGFRNVIATGNEADIDTIEFLHALIDDDETHIILAYIEGLPNARALLDAGRRALTAGKPLLLWKGGVTKEGARAAASHTANMTGSYDFYQALFKQVGIVEITEIHEAVDYVKAFGSRKLPHGRGVAVMGGSGGSAIVFADAAERAGLSFAALSESTQQRLWTVVPEIGAVHNPVDFTAGYFSPRNEDKLATAIQAVLDDRAVDAVCVNFATASGPGCTTAARVVSRLTATNAKPILVFLSTLPEESGEAIRICGEAAVPILPSPVRVARAIATLASYREARERSAGERAVSAGDLDQTRLRSALPPNARGTLSEAEAKRVLECIGVAVTRDVLVHCADDVRFEDLDPPLAVKIVSPDIAHKTGIGGVRLNVRTRAELNEAVNEVLENARSSAPHARIEGVLLSEMLAEGFELLAGVVNDAVFGPVVVVGAGGIYAETLRDTACRLAPFDEKTAHAMLGELRCRPVLNGARGKPALDVDAVARALVALSRFASANRDRIAEIDVNRLFALPAGAVAADALIVLAKEPQAA